VGIFVVSISREFYCDDVTVTSFNYGGVAIWERCQLPQQGLGGVQIEIIFGAFQP